MEGPVSHDDVDAVLFACVVYDLPARHRGSGWESSIAERPSWEVLLLKLHTTPHFPIHKRFLLRLLKGARDCRQ